MRILSWNLLTRDGARADDVTRLIDEHSPDVVLLQEATALVEILPVLVGGHCVNWLMEGREHGPAVWSRLPFNAATFTLPRAPRLDLPISFSGSIRTRLALIVRLGPLIVANVHLDHGQRANRRQLRHLLQEVQPDIVIGDFNALGPIALPGFTEVGPRRTTHWAYGVVPLRLDRCFVRGFRATFAAALEFGPSDHRPILVELDA